jgi:hypothetical protein
MYFFTINLPKRRCGMESVLGQDSGMRRYFYIIPSRMGTNQDPNARIKREGKRAQREAAQMKNVVVLKTPGGRQAGFVRMRREDGKVHLTWEGADRAEKRIVAFFEAKEMKLEAEDMKMEILPDSADGAVASQTPDVLMVLNKDGGIYATGGRTLTAPEMQRMRRKALCLLDARSAEREADEPVRYGAGGEAKAEGTDEEAQEEQADGEEAAAAPASCAAEEDADEEKRKDGDGRHAVWMRGAWPPPLFFPDAEFMDGEWRA